MHPRNSPRFLSRMGGLAPCASTSSALEPIEPPVLDGFCTEVCRSPCAVESFVSCHSAIGFVSAAPLVMSAQIDPVWLPNLALAVRLSFRLLASAVSSSRSTCLGLLPSETGSTAVRFQAPLPRSSSGSNGSYKLSSKTMPRSMLSLNHSSETSLIPHCRAYSYFFPFGDAAIRWVTAFVRSPWYSAPCFVTVSEIFCLCET